MQSYKGKNEIIDYIKGLLMFGVLWGHSITALLDGTKDSSWIHMFIRTYDMPFLMLIAGYLYEISLRKGTQAVLKSKFQKVIIPLLSWSAIIGMTGPISEFHKRFFSLWFVWSYISCVLIILILFVLFPNALLRVVSIVIVIILLHFLPVRPHFHTAFLFPFFVMGFFYQKIFDSIVLKIDSNAIKKVIFPLVCFVYILLLFVWKDEYRVWNVPSSFIWIEKGSYFIVFLRLGIGLIGTICLNVIFYKLYSILFSKANAFFIALGENSMVLYFYQALFLEMMVKALISRINTSYGRNIFNENNIVLEFVYAPILSFLIAITALVFIKLIKKNRLLSHILLGKTL